MKVRIAIVLFVAAFLSFLASNSDAVMHRVNFEAATQTEEGQPDRLALTVEVIDDQLSHPPDFIKEIKITAPATDGSVFYLDLSKDWLPWYKIFFRTFLASDFVGKIIPGGTYKVTVTPDVGTPISESDNVAAKFLTPATVTYPTSGLTGVPETPTFKWKAVSGATYYMIHLYNITWEEPVYSFLYCKKLTDFTSYTIPPGDLKPNTNYRMRIEARSGAQDIDMRSLSGWIFFTTGVW